MSSCALESYVYEINKMIIRFKSFGRNHYLPFPYRSRNGYICEDMLL